MNGIILHFNHGEKKRGNKPKGRFFYVVNQEILANQRDGSFGYHLLNIYKAPLLPQTKSYYVCSGNVVWGWRWR